MVVASCLPKADNTSMAGGRGLLQWYQSRRPDGPARTLGPREGGGWRYPTSGVQEMVVVSRLPKADNTSMAGGRGLLQRWTYPTSRVEENKPRLISVGIPQPIEPPFDDKTVRAGIVVASRLHKADNTSMACGRGLLQRYQSHGPDVVRQW